MIYNLRKKSPNQATLAERENNEEVSFDPVFHTKKKRKKQQQQLLPVTMVYLKLDKEMIFFFIQIFLFKKENVKFFLMRRLFYFLLVSSGNSFSPFNKQLFLLWNLLSEVMRTWWNWFPFKKNQKLVANKNFSLNLLPNLSVGRFKKNLKLFEVMFRFAILKMSHIILQMFTVSKKLI